MLKTCLIPAHNNYFVVRNQNTKISFKFWVGHHEMVSNDQYEDENAEKIGKESEVLVIKHL